MFIKRKRNRSGTVSIVVAEKTSGYYKELTTIGIARTQEEIDTLIMKGRKWIDAEWDGLKGYLTNTKKIEIRPMFHFTRRRIEAHVCICFVALKVYKELERLLKRSDINMSMDKLLELAKTIVTIQITLPQNKQTINRTMLMKRHQRIAPLFTDEFWGTR